MTPYLLLTGATGLLGRYLLRDLLLRDVNVAVLVRPSKRQSAAERVEGLMCTWEAMEERRLPRPVVLEGDICQPGLGLSREQIRWVRKHCDCVLHNAASLTFHSFSPEGEPWWSNVQGTQNVLDVCERTGIRDFHHVSTAYVCGLRRGVVLESELDVGQEHSNDYERSKLQAEKLVRAAEFLSAPTIFRPAIIIGDSQTGFTTTFHGFYALLRVVYTMAMSEGLHTKPEPTYVPVRITLDGHERKNLVPVDWVSAVMAHIVTSPEYHGMTYHLTPQQPVTSQMLCEVVERINNFHGTQFFGGLEEIPDPTESEKLFYEHIRIYNAYWRDDPVFDRTNTLQAAPHLPCPKIDIDLLMHMAEVAVVRGFRFKDRPVRRKAPLPV